MTTQDHEDARYMLGQLARSWSSRKTKDLGMRINEEAVRAVPDPAKLKEIIYQLNRKEIIQSIADILERDINPPETIFELPLGSYKLIMQVLLDERQNNERYCEGLLQYTPSSRVLFSFTDRYVEPF
jgi:hypothetical protein